MSDYQIADSGARASFDSGMVRDVEEGKIDYTYVLYGPMLDRWARHMELGAEKYDRNNWMKATGPAELDRFERSAFRHMVRWLRGDRDECKTCGGSGKLSEVEEWEAYGESGVGLRTASCPICDGSGYKIEDHAAAVIFNINGAEYVRAKLADAEREA